MIHAVLCHPDDPRTQAKGVDRVGERRRGEEEERPEHGRCDGTSGIAHSTIPSSMDQKVISPSWLMVG